MLPEVYAELAKPTQNACIAGLLQRCKDYLKLSRVEMVRHYPDWDIYDQVYRGERAADDQDVKARERKEPMKMVVPLTRDVEEIQKQSEYYRKMEKIERARRKAAAQQ